jgi:hypothetical protein
MILQLLDETDFAHDLEITAFFREAEEKGAPDRNWYRVLLHSPSLMKGFASFWREAFNGGQVNHCTKEILRVLIADHYACSY